MLDHGNVFILFKGAGANGDLVCVRQAALCLTVALSYALLSLNINYEELKC